jgi:hypothetical protein
LFFLICSQFIITGVAGLQFEAAGPHKLLLERYLRQWPLEKVVSTGSFLGAIVVYDTEEKLL